MKQMVPRGSRDSSEVGTALGLAWLPHPLAKPSNFQHLVCQSGMVAVPTLLGCSRAKERKLTVTQAPGTHYVLDKLSGFYFRAFLNVLSAPEEGQEGISHFARLESFLLLEDTAQGKKPAGPGVAREGRGWAADPLGG